jgi:hypothetical protein
MTHLRDAPATLSVDDLDEAHGGIAIGSLGTYLPQQGTTTNLGVTQPIYTGFGQTNFGQPGLGQTLPGYGYGLTPSYVQPALQPQLQPLYGQYGQPIYAQPGLYGAQPPVIIERYYDEPRQDDTAAIIAGVAGFLGGSGFLGGFF